MLKRSLLLLVVLAVATTSCKETLCEKGIYPFCEEDPATIKPGTFTLKGIAPDGIEMTTFTVGNKGYVGAGARGITGDGEKTFYSYNPSGGWDSIADLPSQGRRSAVGFGCASKGYVGGGYFINWVSGEGLTVDLKDFYEYDPESNTWTRKADLPEGEGTYKGFGIGNKGYIIKYLSQKLWQFDPALNAWNQKADYPGGEFRQSFSIGLFGYVLEYSGKLWQYNPLLNEWKEKATAPVTAMSTFATKTKGYAIGQHFVYEYYPLSDVWYKKGATPKIDEYSENGTSLGVQFSFGLKDKGYFSLEYRSTSLFFYEFDPNK